MQPGRHFLRRNLHAAHGEVDEEEAIVVVSWLCGVGFLKSIGLGS